MKRYKGSPGWFNESHRHSLAAQGVKTGRKYCCPVMKPITFSKMSEAEIKQKMQGLYDSAKRLIESGATPMFHLGGAEVGPSVTFMVKDKKDYEKYEVTDDYPFITAQATGISLDNWSEATGVDRDEINILYLGINGPVSELHNASVSLLDADSSEWSQYVDDKWSNVNAALEPVSVEKLKKGYENDELMIVGDDDPHADFYYEYGNKNTEERYKLAKQLIEEWRESEMKEKGQKKITEYSKKTVSVNMSDVKDIKKAERMKSSLENKGYNLIKTIQTGVDKFKLTYDK